MDKEFLHKFMAINTVENLKIVSIMDKECIHSMTVRFSKEGLKMGTVLKMPR